MDIKQLKNHLFQNKEKIVEILESLDFHHVEFHRGHDSDYFTCGNFDGDNRQAITIYLNPSLLTINYTRTISNKQNSDFIDLVKFAKPDLNFFEVLKWISEKAGIDFYSENLDRNIPRSLLLIQTYKKLLKNEVQDIDDDKTHVKPIPEVILSYYKQVYSEMFKEDGISYSTQREFEIGYDQFSNMWVIPIRDELGVLTGVKGRYFDRKVPDDKLKYIYLEPTARNKILYGYYKTAKYIDESDCVYVTESEKGVLQLWSYGYKNVVGVGGTRVGSRQIEMLSRLGKRIVILFDKDFTDDKEKVQDLRNRFLKQIPVCFVIDKDNILGEKESPSDNKDKFIKLIKDNIYEVEFEEKRN